MPVTISSVEQLAGYEQRQFLQALGFHQHQQVVAAAHQIDALDLLKAVNPACHSVKAMSRCGVTLT